MIDKSTLPDVIVSRATTIRNEILSDGSLKNDLCLENYWIPKPYIGGDVKLIIIGQDPTVQNIESRKKIKTVLNLDKLNSLYTYINSILKFFNYGTDNLYATNLYKCFFKEPPAKNYKLLQSHLKYWIDLLIDEINCFPEAIIFTFGEPVIKQLITNKFKKVSYYWNYIGKTTSDKKFLKVEANDNLLIRKFYPLPHQPTYSRNRFYRNYLFDYLNYVRYNEKQF